MTVKEFYEKIWSMTPEEQREKQRRYVEYVKNRILSFKGMKTESESNESKTNEKENA